MVRGDKECGRSTVERHLPPPTMRIEKGGVIDTRGPSG